MISKAVKSLCPDSEFIIENEDYSTIRWIIQPESIPTLEEVEAKVEELKQEQIKSKYKTLRRAEYPSIGDQLDALWKGGEALAEMQAKILAVKTKYPKDMVIEDEVQSNIVEPQTNVVTELQSNNVLPTP